MKKLFAVLLVLTTLVFFSCQKELSNEAGNTPSEGLLQDDGTGDCFPKSVVGTYEDGTALDGNTNYIQVSVDVTKAGSYTIYSDTVNGVFFRLSAIFTSTGVVTVNLRGNGTPAQDGVFNFNINYNGQTCSVPVTFLPTGAGGPAEFALSGTPCTLFAPEGTYVAGTAVNGTHKVTFQVNVTKIGTWSLSTPTVNGYKFEGTGAFLAIGLNTVTLTASGTPTAAGTDNFTVTAGTTSCSFPITVSGAASFTYDCPSADVLGDYEEGVALTATNTVEIDVTVATPGAYSITTNTVNGMTFAGSGTLAAGAQTITLSASGTPLADGDFTFTLPGTPTCSFDVTVDPGTTGPITIDWKFTESGFTYQGPFVDAIYDNTSVPPLSGFGYLGETITADTTMSFDLFDASGGIQNNETYPLTVGVGANFIASFLVEDAALNVLFEGDPTDPPATGPVFTIRVTSHVPATKFIQGTFTGTVKNAAGASKTITLAEFKGTYQ